MKSISITFNIHHPVRLKKYRFFSIGNDSYYYDDYLNERSIKKAAEDCYLPTNYTLANLLREYKGQFKVAFSVSGTAIDLFTLYAPEVIESIQELASTGCVEFLGETYAHSLVSLNSPEEFRKQAEAHADKTEELFGQRPVVFQNTGLIYSDEVGGMAAGAGFKAVLTEGASHILRWRSPNYLYSHPFESGLMLLLNNTALKKNLASRFSNPEWTGWNAEEHNYISMLNRLPAEESIVNLTFDYKTVSYRKSRARSTSDFLKSFPRSVFGMTEFGFMNPSEMISSTPPVASLSVPEPISAAPFEKGVMPFVGNDLQKEAFDKLYEVGERIDQSPDRSLRKDWLYLQSSDHFRYMATEQYAGSATEAEENPYDNFYEAFMNYMNVVSDLTLRAGRSLAILQTDFASKKMSGRMAM